MENNLIVTNEIQNEDWFSDDFIYNSVVKFLKENGYKIQKEDREKNERIITASKFFKKEIIEVKGFPHTISTTHHTTPPKSTHVKSWFTEALFNSFVNFSRIENAEVAIALPNVSRYRAIIDKLYDYFTANDLYFRIYLVNEDSSVEVSNLNLKYQKVAS
jgi:hypothetical protein